MYQIKHIASNTIINVSSEPIFRGGVWDCGDQRFSDPNRDQYEIVPISAPAKISVITFKLLFPIANRVAINAARATDPTIEDFYSLLDDPRTEQVDLALPAVQEMIDYLVSQTLITAELRDAILAYRP